MLVSAVSKTAYKRYELAIWCILSARSSTEVIGYSAVELCEWEQSERKYTVRRTAINLGPPFGAKRQHA